MSPLVQVLKSYFQSDSFPRTLLVSPLADAAGAGGAQDTITAVIEKVRFFFLIKNFAVAHFTVCCLERQSLYKVGRYKNPF